MDRKLSHSATGDAAEVIEGCEGGWIDLLLRWKSDAIAKKKKKKRRRRKVARSSR